MSRKIVNKGQSKETPEPEDLSILIMYATVTFSTEKLAK